MISELLKWIFRAWPVLVEGLLIILHLVALSACLDWTFVCFTESEINELISLFAQLVGGIFVVISIDSNLAVFSKSNLTTVFKNYLAEFPLLKRERKLQPVHSDFTIRVGRPRVKTSRSPETVEEKLEYLQSQIESLEEHVNASFSDVYNEFTEIRKIHREASENTQQEIAKIANSLRSAALGGINLQLLGVLFVIHGAISGYIA